MFVFILIDTPPEEKESVPVSPEKQKDEEPKTEKEVAQQDMSKTFNSLWIP